MHFVFPFFTFCVFFCFIQPSLFTFKKNSSFSFFVFLLWWILFVHHFPSLTSSFPIFSYNPSSIPISSCFCVFLLLFDLFWIFIRLFSILFCWLIVPHLAHIIIFLYFIFSILFLVFFCFLSPFLFCLIPFLFLLFLLFFSSFPPSKVFVSSLESHTFLLDFCL